MITALQAASFISQRYKRENKHDIDEMKLHKLLYFTLRESLIANQEPMFSEQFVAWKYGPVMLCVRDALRLGPLMGRISEIEEKEYAEAFNNAFQRYAGRSSWSLSTLSHGEYSWQKAREGLSPEENGNHKIAMEDIRKDANRIRFRRMFLE